MDDKCHVQPVERVVTPEEQETTQNVALVIYGMGCPNCAMRVRNSLVALHGVVQTDVDHFTGLANITFNPTLLKVIDLVDAVGNAGNDGHHRYGVFSILVQENNAGLPHEEVNFGKT